jgi:hypothetical protein
MNDFQKECERVAKQIKLERSLQKKRLYEQARREQKKASK